MASSLIDLLSRQVPTLQTRKGLLVVGLQNDFISADGKLPMSISEEFWPAFESLIPAFRDFGDVIWIRTEFKEVPQDTAIINSSLRVEYDQQSNVESKQHPDGDHGSGSDGAQSETDSDGNGMGEDEAERDSPVPAKRQRISLDGSESIPTLNALACELSNEATSKKSSPAAIDDEFFLSERHQADPCCSPDSHGAQLCTQASSLVEKRDIQAVTNGYSVFDARSLLSRLRSKLITDLYICGCPTNSSVYATAIDAARHGYHITLLEDCLAARTEVLNDVTIDQLCDILEADAMTGAEAIKSLQDPPAGEDSERGELKVESLRGGDDRALAESDDSSESVRSILAPQGPQSPVTTSDQLSSDVENDFGTLFQSSSTDVKTLVGLEGYSGQPVRVIRAANSEHEDDHTEIFRGSKTSAVSSNTELEDSTVPSSLAHRDSTRALDVHEFLKQNRESNQAPSALSKHPGLNALASLCRLDQKTVDEYETMWQQARGTKEQPLFGEDTEAESKGSTILYGLLPLDLADTAFDILNEEITWQKMYHQTGEVPRLVCCQGSIEDESRPVYRHPSDRTLPVEAWTPLVDRIRRAAADQVGHPLNHALIQLYRGGTDYISEHSDKTLDIARDTYIVNVSFGAQRTMRLRTKRAQKSDDVQASSDRKTHRIAMPPNSMIKMSLATNAEYLHGINADKRPAVEHSSAEKAFDGRRISLTFRNISTFTNADSTLIWGQGATGKTRESAAPVINGDFKESEKLIRAFGAENQATTSQWDAIYGDGSNVLHLKHEISSNSATS